MKSKKAMTIYISILLVFSIFPINTAGQATLWDVIPKLQIVAQPLIEYKDSDTVSFTVNSPNYNGEVQYRVRLNNRTTMETWELFNYSKNGYNTDYKPNGNCDFVIRYPLKGIKTGSYNITVFVKRVGSNAAYDSFVDTSAFNVKSKDPNVPGGASGKTEEEILKVFRGYFENANYKMNLSEYLKFGPQTDSPSARELAKQFNNKKDITTLEEIYSWIKVNLGDYSGNDVDKYSRTVEQIIKSGVLTGSSDYSLVFAALSRAKGIPAIVVNSANIHWVSGFQQGGIDENINGNYSFVEVYINGNWILVNPVIGIIYLDYNKDNMSLPGNYYAFSKSIEVSDTGVKYGSHNTAVTKYIFRDFDIHEYAEPGYSLTYNLGQSIDPRKIIRYELCIVPVCGDKEFFRNTSDIVSIPPELNNKTNLLLPVISAEDAFNNIKNGVPYKAVVLTYISGSYSSGNKQYMPDELAKYLGIDPFVLDEKSRKGVCRQLIEKDGMKFLIIAAPDNKLIEQDMVMNTVDEIF